MDFIEQWFGIAPDHGDGSLEILARRHRGRRGGGLLASPHRQLARNALDTAEIIRTAEPSLAARIGASSTPVSGRCEGPHSFPPGHAIASGVPMEGTAMSTEADFGITGWVFQADGSQFSWVIT